MIGISENFCTGLSDPCDWSAASLGLRFMGPDIIAERKIKDIAAKIEQSLACSTTVLGEDTLIWRSPRRSLILAIDKTEKKPFQKIAIIALPPEKLVESLLTASEALLPGGPASRVPGAIGTLQAVVHSGGQIMIPGVENPSSVIVLSHLQTHMTRGLNCSSSLMAKCIGWRRDALELLFQYAHQIKASIAIGNDRVLKQLESGTELNSALVMKANQYGFRETSGEEWRVFVPSG